MFKRAGWLCVLMGAFLAILAGCSAAGEPYTQGSVILSEAFSEPSAWETYSDTGVDLRVSDGVYLFQTGDAGYIWGLNEQIHRDVVIEVAASQVSVSEDNAYGVMCRADTSNNGDGYYFLVSGDGFYTIARGEGDSVSALLEWTESEAIVQGAGTNTIRAVCIGDYLGMYVNGRFLTELRDETYLSGYAGLAGIAFQGGEMTIHFDNLTIWEAALGE